MPIAILKFPTDLLRDVFKFCDPFELYCLSKCSKRTQRSIKSGGTKNWKLRFSGDNKIVTTADGLQYDFDKAEKPRDNFKRRYYKRRYLHTYMKIEFDDPFDVFFYLIDTFRIRILESLWIHFGTFDKFSNAARELINRNIEIEVLHISYTTEVRDVDKLMPLLNQMNITQKFECLRKFAPDFHHQFAKYPNQLYISQSSWFNIDQLLDCTCVRIELLVSMLSNKDLDVFLKKWKMTGTFPNLRFLKIMSCKIDNKSPILDMVPPIENAGNPRIEVTLDNNHVESITDAVRITKDDGTEGYLKVVLGNDPKLEFLVSNPKT
ncbi:unnamed protein product [Caenorhabditis nigoni]